MKHPEKVCIIGGGSSGIVAAKILHERGIPFDCIEKGSGIGGNWRFNNDNGMSSSYASLHINTSRRMMQYSDYPMPRHYPDFPHHSQILEYFEEYVDHFGFRDRIAFRTTVEKVVPQADGTYVMEVTDGKGRKNTAQYRSVFVANGHHWKPSLPDFPGEFTGTEMHSHYYKTPDPFRGQRVLIVGLGNSACDMACELSRVCDKVFLSVRRGAHIIPKYLLGKPLDQLAPPWVWRWSPQWLMQFMFNMVLRMARGRITRFGLPQPEHKILEEHPTISSELLNLIGHGKIHMKPNLAHLRGGEIEFTDNSIEEVDVIIYATGYQIAFPFLDNSVIHPKNNEVELYKLVVHPELAHLYFIGLVQPWGAIMPLAELQSEWAADLLEGKTVLPSRVEMKRDIEIMQERIRSRYTNSRRHTIQVDFHKYWDEIAKERRRVAHGSPDSTSKEERPRIAA